MDTNSVHDEMAIYFAIKTLIRDKASRCRRLEYSVLKCINNLKSNHNYVKYQTEETENNTNWQISFEYFLIYQSQSI
jgi:hypothetical protein